MSSSWTRISQVAIPLVALLLISHQNRLQAEVIVDTLPANNQANLSVDVGQTFTTGILTETTLSRILIEGPQVAGPGVPPLGPFVLELWTDTDGNHATWDPGTLIASSTTGTIVAGGASRTPFDFPTLPALSNNTVYGFTFTDGSGTRLPARLGLTNANAISDGTLFHLGAPVFSDAFDISMQIITGGPLGSLDLVINRDTGNVTFENSTPQPLANIISYAILSEAGGLNPAGWNQVADGGLANNDDDWTLVTASATELNEAVLVSSGSGDGGDLVASSGVWNLGNIWRPSPFEDVAMEVLLDDGTLLVSGQDFQIVYTGNDDASFSLGDLAGATIGDSPNGTIDLVDWQKFKAVYGSDVSGLSRVDAYLNGDLNADGVSNMTDFAQFRTLFDQANGEGAFALAVGGTAVPEPGTWLLLVCGGFVAMLAQPIMHRRLLAAMKLCCLFLAITLGTTATAQVPVEIFSDDFDAYPVGDPADFAATGNWTHNGNGTAPNASRIFNTTTTYGGERLWIASAANAQAGSGLDSRGIAPAEGLFSNTQYTFSAALVAETFDGNRTATGTYDLLKGTSLATATSLIGGPQAFSARGDDIDGAAPNNSNSYDDQRTTHSFNTGTLAAGDLLFVSIAFNGTDASNPFVGIDEVMILGEANLGARVNITTGNVTLFGDANYDFDIVGYSLTSEGGQLLPGNFTSLESQGIGDPSQTPHDGVGFEVLGTPSAGEIAEGHLLTSTIFDGSTNLSLGNIFNTTTPEPARDLILTLTTASGEQLNAVVDYVTPSALAGDYNGDGLVDARDYVVWRNNLGAADESAINFNGDGGGVTVSDYTFWKGRYGDTAGGSLIAEATVPEPASFALLAAIALVASRCRFPRRWGKVALAAMVTGLVALNSSSLAVEIDRQYDLGDDPAEPSSPGATVGSATYDSAGTPGAGDLQDLQVNGAPQYVSVANRPGAAAGDLGIAFSGNTDALYTGISMNAPSQMWNNPTFFPGPPPQIFPHNYNGIFSHGLQLWAKPNVAAIGSGVQTLVADTTEHGVGISAAGNWELLYDDLRFDTGVAVASTLDASGWVHLMEITEPGGNASGGTLLVNGVAVYAHPTSYDPDAAPLVIGAEPDGSGGFINHYNGVLDDVRLFFWGDNSNQLGQDNAVGGTNSGGPAPTPIVLNADGRDWGGLELGSTNDWIRAELSRLGVTDPGDVDLSGGPSDAADAAAFVTHWRKQQLINGVQVGDWNSRQQGDLNFDGVVDMFDLFILHESLTASGAGGFNFALLGGPAVPEPASALLAVGGLAAGVVWLRRRRR